MPFVGHVVRFINGNIHKRIEALPQSESQATVFFVCFFAGCVGHISAPKKRRRTSDRSTKPIQCDLIFLLFMGFKRYGRHRQFQYICLYLWHGSMALALYRLRPGPPSIQKWFRDGSHTLKNVPRIYWLADSSKSVVIIHTYTSTHAHSHSRPEWTANGGKPGNFFSHMHAHGEILYAYTAHFLFCSAPAAIEVSTIIIYDTERYDPMEQTEMDYFIWSNVTMLVFGLPKCPPPQKKVAAPRVEGAKNVPSFFSLIYFTLWLLCKYFMHTKAFSIFFPGRWCHSNGPRKKGKIGNASRRKRASRLARVRQLATANTDSLELVVHLNGFACRTHCSPSKQSNGAERNVTSCTQAHAQAKARRKVLCFWWNFGIGRVMMFAFVWASQF